MSVSCSPFDATENENIQGYSKDIHNKEKIYSKSKTDRIKIYKFVVVERIYRYGSYSLAGYVSIVLSCFTSNCAR